MAVNMNYEHEMQNTPIFQTALDLKYSMWGHIVLIKNHVKNYETLERSSQKPNKYVPSNRTVRLKLWLEDLIIAASKFEKLVERWPNECGVKLEPTEFLEEEDDNTLLDLIFSDGETSTDDELERINFLN